MCALTVLFIVYYARVVGVDNEIKQYCAADGRLHMDFTVSSQHCVVVMS